MIKKGDKFDRLTVIKEVTSIKKSKKYLCACSCGNVKYIYDYGLKTNKNNDCGCGRAERIRERQTKHGHTADNGKYMSHTYTAWLKMRQRCNNPKSDKYLKGINCPAKWESFEVFLEDMGIKPEGKMFVRIDQKKDYSVDNCAYADYPEVKKLRDNLK